MRVVILDRFQFVAEALRAYLDGHAGIHVVGVFDDGSEQTIEAIQELEPDVVLVEMKTGGSALLRRLNHRVPGARLLALTSLRNQDEETAARNAGAHGYLQKDHDRRGLLEQILQQPV